MRGNKRKFILTAGGRGRPPLRTPIAYAVFSPIGDGYDIIFIRVVPEFRRQGIGRKLIEGFIEKINPKSIMLEVRKGNLAAIGLYMGIGFEIISERIGYYGNGEDAVVMKLTI